MVRNWKHESVKKLISEQGGASESDPVEIIKSLTRELVLNAFTKGWVGPPFDIIELSRMLDIEVMPNDMVSDARISPKNKGKFLIEYNPYQPAPRINFSIAHEIGHTLFSDCADTIRYRAKAIENNSWELEFLCNVGAAEILLPYAKFSADANAAPLTIDSLKALANKYQASLEAVFIRFCEVVNKPCMVLLTKFNEEGELDLEYLVKSSSCDLNFKNDFTIPKKSLAYECIKSGWTSHAIENWHEFGETNYRVFSVGLPSNRKQTEQRVGIFLVPEFYDDVKQSVYTITGDATEPRGEGNKIIAQVVNTSAGLGMGFGKALSKKYPRTKVALDTWKGNKQEFVLGESQIVEVDENTFVVQMVAQKGIFPKYGEIPLKYSSLHKCLIYLAEKAIELNASVHMPLIGAGQAKGDWEIIEGMIFQELVKKNIDVTVYTLPKSKLENERIANTLRLFE